MNRILIKETENEDTFGFSPAYLCECALQNQETSVIQEEPCVLNKKKSQSNVPRSRKGPHHKITTLNSGVNGIKEQYCPTLLCESILEKKSVHHLPPKSTSKNSVKNNSKSRSRTPKCISKTTNSILSNKNLLNHNKTSKNIHVNNYNEEYCPALLCETILQTGNNSAIELKSKFIPKNSQEKINNLKKGKQNCSDKTAQNESNQDQGYGLKYFYENKSKYKDISMFPVPKNSQEITGKSNVPKSNPPKKRKLQDDTQKGNLGKEDNDEVQEYNTAFLCESVISSEETPTLDLSLKSCSTNKVRKVEKIKKTKTKQRNVNSNRNEKQYNHVEKKFGNPTQNRAFSVTTSDVIQCQVTKDGIPAATSLGRLSSYKSKPHRSEINLINKNNNGGKKCAKNPVKKRTCKNISRTPKTSSKENCSLKDIEGGQQRDIRLLENNTADPKEVKHTRKRKRNNGKCLKAEKHTSTNLGNRISQSDDFSVVSKLNPLKFKICRTRSLNLNCMPSENENLRNNVKEAIGESSHTQGYNSTVCEEPSDSEIASVISGYSSDGGDNQLSCKQNNNPQEHNTINHSGNTLQSHNIDVVLKSDVLEDVTPENRLLDGSFEEKEVALRGGENNKLETCRNLSFVEERITGDLKTSCNDESKHSSLDLERSIEEITFVECNAAYKQNEFSPDLESGDQTSEIDPFELHSTGTSVSECQPTIVKTNVNTVEITPLGKKEVNISDVHTNDFVSCDLHLECTLEDTETIKSEFHNDDSDGNDIFGIVSPCFDIFITSSLERFTLSNLRLINNLDSISKLTSQLKVTHELLNNDRKDCCSTKTQHLVGVDEAKLMCRGENDLIKTTSTLSYCSNKFNEELNAKSEREKVSHIDTTNLGESFNKCISESENIIKNESSVGVSIESEVLSIIEEIISKAVVSKLSSTENLNQEDKSMSPCPQNIKSFELMSKNKQSDHTKNDGVCKKEDDRDESKNLLVESTSGEDCRTLETLSKNAPVKVLKKGLKFHEERVLKVLLRRLEEEDIFKVWKKDGVIPLMKRSMLKSSLGHKKPHSKKENNGIQKSTRKRTNFKCFACKKIFKDRKRFWEHRASKCDTLRVFGCGNCNRKYILKKMLDDHRQKCLSVKYFRCKECFKLFNSQERLEEHIASMCDTQKVFQCDVCERSFVFKRLLIIHRTPICTSLRRYRCSTCNQFFDDKTSLRAHKLKDHGIGKDNISVLCEFCGKLISRRHFSNHLNTHFSDEVILFRCKICPQVFSNKRAKVHHENCHKDFKPCICADCGKAFNRLSDLKKHVSGQSSINRCPFCGKVILNHYCFRAHVDRHNKFKVSIGKSLKVEIKEEQHDEYSQSIGTGNVLESLKSEDVKTESIKTEEVKTEFESLHKFYDWNVQSGQYQESSLNETGYFKCNHCFLHCPNKDDLLEHMKSHQDLKIDVGPVLVDKVFKCEECGNGFSNRTNLKRHCQRMHNAPKKSSKETLKIPSTERPYPCEICGTCFGDTSNLRRHIARIHRQQVHNATKNSSKEILKIPTRERPYPCEICGTYFGHKRNLRRHFARIHRKNTESLFPCAFCDEKFTNEVIFKHHTFEHINNSIQCTSLSVNVTEEENKCKNSDVKDFIDTPIKEKPLDLFESSFEVKWNLDMHQAKVQVITINEQEEYTTIKEDEDRNLKQSREAINVDVNEGRDLRGCNVIEVCSNKSPVRNCVSDSKNHQTQSHACRECGVVFFHKWKLNRHLLSHNPLALRCHVCQKRFTSRLKLNVHMLVHGIKNSEQPTFKCLTCNKLFPSSKKLEEHSILHTDQNPYQCTKCSKKFATSYSLKRHNDNVHADKRFLCSYCNMSFVAFSSLNQHVTNVHKKAVSLTEYILRIDDDSATEAAEPAVRNIHTDGAGEVNLQPQVFANICNMFMSSDMYHASTLPSEKQPEVSHTVVNTQQLDTHLTGETRPPLSREVSTTYI